MKLFPNKIKFWNFLQQVDTRTTGELLKSFSPLKRYIAYNLITDEHRLVNLLSMHIISIKMIQTAYTNTVGIQVFEWLVIGRVWFLGPDKVLGLEELMNGLLIH